MYWQRNNLVLVPSFHSDSIICSKRGYRMDIEPFKKMISPNSFMFLGFTRDLRNNSVHGSVAYSHFPLLVLGSFFFSLLLQIFFLGCFVLDKKGLNSSGDVISCGIEETNWGIWVNKGRRKERRKDLFFFTLKEQNFSHCYLLLSRR